ncbi:MAG: GntR family transcriptional regulator [Acidobacteria bacterium]|nr:GntR family transcriptional regulator [Acidobacteriota bacterium]MCB9399292.1 GntR family transcriptional regulator [Acidobacteriota bacterium]
MLATLPSKSLAGKAYNLIEEKIVTLEMKPGQIFTEMELVEQLNIGRTPVREALQLLKHQGLINVLPRKGMIVTDINVGDFFLMLETRQALEALLISKACKRSKPEHKKELARVAHAMHTAAENSDTKQFMRLDHEFDVILCDAARNRYATAALAPLHAHSRRLWFYAGRDEKLTQPASFHIRMMEGLQAEDEEMALEGLHGLMGFLNNMARGLIEVWE